MKKNRTIVPVILLSVPVSLGVAAVACGSYDQGGGNTGGAGGVGAGGGCGVFNGPPPPTTLPGKVLNDAGIPVVSAHSTVRVIVPGYAGPLYQVCKGTSMGGPASCKGTPLDIGTCGGYYADTATQDAFCTDAACTITKVYDQSGKGNDLEPAPPGGNNPSPSNPVKANGLPVTINGVPAYGMLFRPGMGYRTGCLTCTKTVADGTAKGDEPQTIYMVTSQHDLENGCCFDYGNAETTSNNDRSGTMETVYFGGGVVWGTGNGEVPGPWVMADLEDGLFAGWENGQDQGISTNTTLFHDFVTGVIIGDTADKNGGKGRFAIYGGDATTGTLKEMYDGIRPEKPGYNPMKKQGSIILGIGGDASGWGGGHFYEGIMGNGVAPREVVDALQAAIVAAGYGK